MVIQTNTIAISLLLIYLIQPQTAPLLENNHKEGETVQTNEPAQYSTYLL